MNYNYDHERFLQKNKMLAQGYSEDERDKFLKKHGIDNYSNEEPSCFNCKLRTRCAKFNQMRSGGALKVATVGGDTKFICDNYTPEQKKKTKPDDKKIKSLMRNFKKGRL